MTSSSSFTAEERTFTAEARRRGDATRKGVTLLELLTVMVMVMILAATVAPRLSDFFPSLQVDQSARQVLAWARKAHADAALTGARQRLVFNPGARTIRLEAEDSPLRQPGKFKELTGAWRRETLTEGVELTVLEGLKGDSEKYLEFAPDGTTSDATIVLANDRGDRQTIEVTGVTGKVVIQKAVQP